jgi:hypothetical protein
MTHNERKEEKRRKKTPEAQARSEVVYHRRFGGEDNFHFSHKTHTSLISQLWSFILIFYDDSPWSR